jgi:hypothetical protein
MSTDKAEQNSDSSAVRRECRARNATYRAIREAYSPDPENGVSLEQIKRTVRKHTNWSVPADDVDQALDELEERQTIYRADGRYRVLEA